MTLQVFIKIYQNFINTGQDSSSTPPVTKRVSKFGKIFQDSVDTVTTFQN